jgi:hypothetical protein
MLTGIWTFRTGLQPSPAAFLMGRIERQLHHFFLTKSNIKTGRHLLSIPYSIKRLISKGDTLNRSV